MSLHPVLPVRVDAAWFGLDALAVEEILSEAAFVALPRARPEIPGVLPWRGKALPVVDMAAAGGSEPSVGRGRFSRVAVVRSAEETFALPVHGVREVYEVSRVDIEAPGPDRPSHVTAEVCLSGDSVGLVDLPSLLACVAELGPSRSSSSENRLEDSRRPSDRPGAQMQNLVAIAGERADYAIIAEVVRAIVLRREWTGLKLVDLAELVGAPSAPSENAFDRLIVLSDDRTPGAWQGGRTPESSGNHLAVRVTGSVTFRQLEPSRILPMPALLRGRASYSLVSAVAFADERQPLIVLDPAELSRGLAPVSGATSIKGATRAR
jgi:chemotaxis signal transduction protein